MFKYWYKLLLLIFIIIIKMYFLQTYDTENSFIANNTLIFRKKSILAGDINGDAFIH